MDTKYYLLHLHGGTILTQIGPFASEKERAEMQDRLRGNFVDHDHVIHDDEGSDSWIWAEVTGRGDLIAET